MDHRVEAQLDGLAEDVPEARDVGARQVSAVPRHPDLGGGVQHGLRVREPLPYGPGVPDVGLVGLNRVGDAKS